MSRREEEEEDESEWDASVLLQVALLEQGIAAQLARSGTGSISSPPLLVLSLSEIGVIQSKLLKYQRKIATAIQRQPESTNNLAPLLELHDKIDQVLARADIILPFSSSSSGGGDGSRLPSPRDSLDGSSGFGNSSSSESSFSLPNILYVLNRRGSRIECINAVAKLVRQCETVGPARANALKDMSKRETICALLSSLHKVSDWPDVEHQISRVIAILVTYEENFDLLLRNAFDILSCLYTMQLKATARTRSRSNSSVTTLTNTNLATNMTRAQGGIEEAASLPLSSGGMGGRSVDDEHTMNTPPQLSRENSQTSQPRRVVDTGATGGGIATGEANDDVRILVALALAKLSLVLTTEWGKSETPFVLPPSPAYTSSVMVDREFGLAGSQSGGGGELKRTLSSNMMVDPKGNGGATRRRSTSGGSNVAAAAVSAEVTNSRTLEVMLNIIMIFCSESGEVASMEPSTSTFAGQLSRSDSGSNQPLPLQTEAALAPMRDTAAILCSGALANLALLSQCRQNMVPTLKLLRTWLEQVTLIITAHSSPLSISVPYLAATRALAINASRALYLILGGNEEKQQHQHHHRKTHDSAMAWVDDAVIREGIPLAIVKIIKSTSENDNCLLPRAATCSLAQSLYQLSRRHNNRQHLLSIEVPLVLCNLLSETANSYNSSHVGGEKSTTNGETGEGGAVFTACLDCLSYFLSDAFFYLPNPPPPLPVFSSTVPASSRDSSSSSAQDAPPTQTLVDLMSSPKVIDSIKTIITTLPRGPARLSALNIVKYMTEWEISLNALFHGDITDALILISSEAEEFHANNNTFASALRSTIASVSSSSISFFSSAKQATAVATETAVAFVQGKKEFGVSEGGAFSRPKTLNRSLSSNDYTQPKTSSSTTIVRPSAIVDGNTVASTSFARSVSHTPSSSTPMIIFSAASTASPLTSPPPSESGEEAVKPGPRLSLLLPPPTRSTSTTSDASAPSSFGFVSESAAEGAGSSRDSLSLLEVLSTYASPAHQTACCNESKSTRDEVETVSKPFSAEQALEETMTVCIALANICQKREFALRVYKNGLVDIMLRLSESNNVEISRQALRCISAMCPILWPQTNSTTLEKRQEKRRLAACLDILFALTKALKSQISLVQKEALVGIASLAQGDEQLRDSIVETGQPETHLKSILNLMIDPSQERDLRNAAETVLIACGWTGGISDYELCQWHFPMLLDWFKMKKALKPQTMLNKMIEKWVSQHLFHGFLLVTAAAPVASSSSTALPIYSPSSSSTSSSSSSPYSSSRSQSPVPATDTGAISLDSSCDSGEEGNFEAEVEVTANLLQIRSQSKPNSAHTPKSHSSDSHTSPHLHTRPNGGQIRSNSSIGNSSDVHPQLQNKFVESIYRYLPFCLAKSSVLGGGGGVSRSGGGGGRGDGAYASTPTTGPQTSTIQRLLGGVTMTGTGGGGVGGVGEADFSQYLMDSPPYMVLRAMDFFYPSRIHKLAILDLISLGGGYVVGGTDTLDEEVDESSYEGGARVDEEESGMIWRDSQTPRPMSSPVTIFSASSMFSLHVPPASSQPFLPSPSVVYSLSFSNKNFSSFEREARVAEKMMSDGVSNSGGIDAGLAGGNGKGGIKEWSLSFRDSVFSGEFHDDLTSCLRKNAQIVSLTFYTEALQQSINWHMGYFAGHVPSSVKFLSFHGQLNKESFKAMCIILRNENDAFKAPLGHSGDQWDAHHHHHQNPSSSSSSSSSSSASPHTGREPRLETHKKGLLGLAVTGCTFNIKEIMPSLVALIEGHRVGGGSSSFSSSRHLEGGLYGLRLLDLSYNSLDDKQCAEVLRAAARGPVEGLELSGNPTNQAVALVEAFQAVFLPTSISKGTVASEKTITCPTSTGSASSSTSTSCSSSPSSSTFHIPPHHGHSSHIGPPQSIRLRHIGLSHLALPKNAICTILRTLTPPPPPSHSEFQPSVHKYNNIHTLTSLDISRNEIQHSQQLVDALKDFLPRNKTLRSLDLSFNQLTAETVSTLHWGVLENESILLLPMCGNANAMTSSENNRLQQKLANNRLKYREMSETWVSEMEKRRAEMEKRRADDLRREEKQKQFLSLLTADEDPLMNVPTSLAPTTTSTSLDRKSEKDDAKATGAGGRTALASTSPWAREFVVEDYRQGRSGGVGFGTSLSLGHRQGGSFKSNYGEAGGGGGGGGQAGVATAVEVSVAEAGVEMAVAVPVAEVEEEPSLNKRVKRGEGGAAGGAKSPRHQEQKYQQQTSEKDVKEEARTAAVLAASSVATQVASSSSSSSSSSSLITTATSIAAVTGEGGDGGGSSSATTTISSTISSSNTNLSIELNTPLPISTLPPLPSPSHVGNSSGSNTNKNLLMVLFSAPLAWRDRSNALHPLEILNYGAERDVLLQVFKEVKRDLSIVVDFATTDALRTALSFGCRALHFSGHGHPSCLNFEDGRSGLQLVSTDMLKSLLRAGGLKLDFVFVSACHSLNTGQAFIDCGVRHVVCVKVEAAIQDTAAVAFTRAFYLALLCGNTVQQSFDIGREQLKASPFVSDSVLEGDKFVLLPEVSNSSNGASLSSPVIVADYHHVPIFSARPVPVWPLEGQCVIGRQAQNKQQGGFSPSSSFASLSSSASLLAAAGGGGGVGGSSGNLVGSGGGGGVLEKEALPSPPPDFEGREVDMHRLIITLMARRLVSLVGDEGVGKSALAAATCSYLVDRGIFEEGVMFVRLQDKSTHMDFLRALEKTLDSWGLGDGHIGESGGGEGGDRGSFGSEISVAEGEDRSSLSRSSAQAQAQDTSVDIDHSEEHALTEQTDQHTDSYTRMLFVLEEKIVLRFSLLKILVVLDNVDTLMCQQESAEDLRFFLSRLFERCKYIKVLVTATQPLQMKSGFGVVENSVSLGNLTLRNTLRLFARLAPSLHTAAAKTELVNSLLPIRTAHVTVNSRLLSKVASQLLHNFGNGHPARVIKMACESTPESVEMLRAIGAKIIAGERNSAAAATSGEGGGEGAGGGKGENKTDDSAPLTPISSSSATALSSSPPPLSPPPSPSLPSELDD